MSEKFAKCNFKSQSFKLHKQLFFLMKWTVFAMQTDGFHVFEAFLQKEKVILEL